MDDRINVQELWKIIDEERPDYNLLTILKKAKSRGLDINQNLLGHLVESMGHYGTTYQFCPKFISDFLISYLKEISITSIFDPSSGISSFLAPIVEEYKINNAISISECRNNKDIAQLLYQSGRIDWKVKNPFEFLNEIYDNFFDVIVCNPHWNMERSTIEVDSHIGKVTVQDSLEKLLFLQSSIHLKQNGVSFFLLPHSFINKKPNSVYSIIEMFGLFIEAILTIPSGNFIGTSVSGLLVILRRKKFENLFVGELSKNQGFNNVLLENLRRRKNGKTPQLGFITSKEAFRTFDVILTELEIDKLSNSFGYPIKLLSEIILEVNSPNNSLEEGFNDVLNSIYLPCFGNSSAVTTSTADFKLKYHNYYQLVLNPDIAKADYIAGFFTNTQLGHMIRLAARSGTMNRRISKALIPKMKVGLPNLDVQSETIRLQSIVTNLTTQIEEIHRVLWRKPRKIHEIEIKLQKLKQEEDIVHWIESLPFPLASILWAYHASLSEEKKLDFLLLFFEASAQFITVLLISGFASDPLLYKMNSDKWNDPNYEGWYNASSFGNWIAIGEKIAKAIRTLLSNTYKKDHILNIFGSNEQNFLEINVKKKFFSIFKNACDIRNDLRHRGVISLKETRSQLIKLEKLLTEFRQALKNCWHSSILLQPISSKYKDGIFNYQVRSIMGSRTPFKQIEVRTSIPMEEGELYLLIKHNIRIGKPILIQPFIKLMESPKTQKNACYFYNKVVGDKVRFVSYHYEEDSEIIHIDKDVKEAFSLFKQNRRP